MAQTRREFLKTAAAVSAASVAGIAVPPDRKSVV